MVEIDTLFQAKTTNKKNIPFGATHIYIAYIREYPLPPQVNPNPNPPPSEKRVADYESRCLRKRH